MRALNNSVQLIGNLGKNPEVKDLNGSKVANFTIATNERYKDKDGNKVEKVEWHNIVVWGGLANIVEKYLVKGSKILVEGKLQHRSYEDKDGNKRFITEILANDIMMLDKQNED